MKSQFSASTNTFFDGGATGWVMGENLGGSFDDVLGLCMECLLRSVGTHYHGVMGWALKREAHQGWFRADTLDMMRQGLSPKVDMGGVIGYADSWSYEARDGVEYLKLTIDPSETEPEARTVVWRLRYDQAPRVFHGIFTIQGTWPD